MEIKIDTGLLQQMANASLRAMNAVEEATKAANTITLHNDWNCIERDYIDESVQNIKKSNNKINENMAEFSGRLNELAEKFAEFDRSLLEKFSDFDSSVGKALAVKAENGIFKRTGGYIPENFFKKLTIAEDYQSIYNIKNFNCGLSVVNFSDAQQIIEGK